MPSLSPERSIAKSRTSQPTANEKPCYRACAVVPPYGWLKWSDLTLPDFSLATNVQSRCGPCQTDVASLKENILKFVQTQSTILRPQQLPLGKILFRPTLGVTLHNQERPLTRWELVSLTLCGTVAGASAPPLFNKCLLI